MSGGSHHAAVRTPGARGRRAPARVTRLRGRSRSSQRPRDHHGDGWSKEERSSGCGRDAWHLVALLFQSPSRRGPVFGHSNGQAARRLIG